MDVHGFALRQMPEQTLLAMMPGLREDRG